MPERYTEDKTVQCTPVSTPVYYPYWIDLMQVAMDDPIQVNYFATTNTMDVMEVNADNQKLYLKASPTGEEQAVSMDISSGIVANMLMNVSFTLSNQSEHFTSIQIQQQNANMEWETLASTTVAREADVNLDFTPANTSMLKLIIKGHDMDVIVGAIKYKRLDLFGTSVVSTICNSSEFDDDYRFGFNGQMKDNEIKGIGNSLSFLHRIYDSRLGKFLSVDPLFGSYPWNSSYAFAENDVIRCIDLEGLERLIMTTYLYQKNGTLVKLDQGIAKTDGNWKGDKYRESYFFEGKKHKDGSYAYYSEGGQDRNGTAMMNMHKDNPLFFSKQLKEKQEAQEKFNKCTKDVLTITGGVIAIIATGGAVLAVEGGMSALTALGAAWSLTSAEIAVTGGVTKLALDLNGNKASEKIPTSLGGAVGLTVDYTVGNKNGKFQAMGDIADGILTFNIPKNLTQGANATLSITNIALAVPDATKSEKK
jgi:RHS repeat-associated protein